MSEYIKSSWGEKLYSLFLSTHTPPHSHSKTLTWVVVGVHQAFGQPGGNRVTWESWLSRDKLNSSKSWHWLMCAGHSSNHIYCFSCYSQQLCELGTREDEEIRGRGGSNQPSVLTGARWGCDAAVFRAGSFPSLVPCW